MPENIQRTVSTSFFNVKGHEPGLYLGFETWRSILGFGMPLTPHHELAFYSALREVLLVG